MPRTIKRAGIDAKVISSRVVSIFEKIKDNFLDSESAKKVQAVYFEDSILRIASLSAGAAQGLVAKEEEIIERLNDLIGQKVVEKIKIIV